MSCTSPYAEGRGLKLGRPGPGIEARDFTGRAWELLELLNEAGALTSGPAARVLETSRHKVASAFETLRLSGMARYADVFTPRSSFRLWFPAASRPPREAGEACRLAALAMLFAAARREVVGFAWQILRNGKVTGVMARMDFRDPDGRDLRWIIDAPRSGEVPAALADLYIVPGENDAALVPPGKLYITDEVLLEILETGEELGSRLREKTLDGAVESG